MTNVGDGWRDLEAHEIIREGDEWRGHGDGWKWLPEQDSTPLGGKSVHAVRVWNGDPRLYYRRRIRIQSPGWRWLDEGETIREGDEFERRNPPQWGVVKRPAWHGVVKVRGEYRRRIDAPVTDALTREQIQDAIDAGSDKLREEAEKNFKPLRSCIETGCPCARSVSRMCGCGKHRVDPRGDVYEQHRNWVAGVGVLVEVNDWHRGASQSRLHNVTGIGISAKREIEVLCSIDDVDGGGV